MTSGLRLAGWLLALCALVLAAGCAHPQRSPAAAEPGTSTWTGRMALQVQDNASQSFSAGFELQGNARSGELSLFNPLGGTIAVLAWGPGTAVLRANGQTRQFESLDALATHATGAPIPVTALFDWLGGANTPVPGWQPDLSQLGQGRLRAQRTDPQPQVDLRLAFDR